MKSLLIEAVVNGYIVRPFTDSCGWARGDQGDMYVYYTVEDLLRDLPKLIAEHVDCLPSQQAMENVTMMK